MSGGDDGGERWRVIGVMNIKVNNERTKHRGTHTHKKKDTVRSR